MIFKLDLNLPNALSTTFLNLVTNLDLFVSAVDETGGDLLIYFSRAKNTRFFTESDVIKVS